MRVGVPKEIKIQEGRVAVTPAGVDTLKSHGHDVFIEIGAGLDSGIPDSAFEKAGAVLMTDPDRWGGRV